ncbi:hypothetical protein PSPO01_06545 [Paraphaeosphaeria sporulosa]
MNASINDDCDVAVLLPTPAVSNVGKFTRRDSSARASGRHVPTACRIWGQAGPHRLKASATSYKSSCTKRRKSRFDAVATSRRDNICSTHNAIWVGTGAGRLRTLRTLHELAPKGPLRRTLSLDVGMSRAKVEQLRKDGEYSLRTKQSASADVAWPKRSFRLATGDGGGGFNQRVNLQGHLGLSLPDFLT